MPAVVRELVQHPKLTDQQMAAYDAAKTFCTGQHGARMMTLEGYAGTGKTTIVGALVRFFGHRLKVAVAAPTNKAVAVLADKIGESASALIEFGSIHSFLGLRMTERDDGRHDCVASGDSTLHHFDLAIIDECSMIGPDLFGRIVTTASSNNVRILFVGDPAQLPPVDSNGEQSPTFSHVQHKALLTEVVRQAADNPIISLSMKIRAAIEGQYRMDAARIGASVPVPPADVLMLSGGAEAAISCALHDLRDGRDTRILAFTNAAVMRYNTEIHHALYGSELPFARGEAVIMQDAHQAASADIRNPVRVQLMNSEELIVRELDLEHHPKHPTIPAWRLTLDRDSGQAVRVWIPVDPVSMQREISRLFGEAAKLKAELTIARNSDKDAARRSAIATAWALKNDFANARHCYAMTIHKSQGSTLYTTIIDLSDVSRMRDDFDYNRALYVATTRASNHLAFVA